VQLSTKVSPEFDEKLRHIAQRDGLMMVEVLERALEAYEKAR
jgi:predicted transcriptional regulator